MSANRSADKLVRRGVGLITGETTVDGITHHLLGFRCTVHKVHPDGSVTVWPGDDRRETLRQIGGVFRWLYFPATGIKFWEPVRRMRRQKTCREMLKQTLGNYQPFREFRIAGWVYRFPTKAGKSTS